MKKRIKVLLMAMCLAGMSAICGCAETNTVQQSGSTEKENDAIKLAVYPLPTPYFQFAVEGLNKYEEYGANVELTYFAQYSDVIQALDSGNVDGAIMGITEAVSPIINDLGLEIICMTDYSYGMDGIVASADLTSIQDLAGETVATNVGTMNHMLLLNALEEAGLQAEDVNIVNMSEGDAAAAFVGGSIKAASIFDPQMTTAAEEGNGTILYSSQNMKGQLADVLLMSENVTKNRQEEVQGIVDAWFDTWQEFEEDDAQCVSLIAEQADMTEDEYRALLDGLEFASLDYNQEVFADQGAKMQELVMNVADFLYEADCIEAVPSKDAIAKAINSTFIDTLAEEKQNE